MRTHEMVFVASMLLIGGERLAAAGEDSAGGAGCDCSPVEAAPRIGPLAQVDAATQAGALAQADAAAQATGDTAPFRIAGFQFDNRADFVGQGRRCGTPTPTADELEMERNAVAAVRRVAGAARLMSRQTEGKVRVVFHVIHKGDEGRISREQIERQVLVLNQAFQDAGFTFELEGINFKDVAGDPQREGWFNMSHTNPPSPTEMNAKAELGRDSSDFLNIYTAKLRGGLLGWATFPSDLATGSGELGYDPKVRDGVVVLYTSLPAADGSPNPQGGPFGLGQTLTHEVGHYLGLFHTFQGGCLPPGDEVADTPSHQVNFGACPPPGGDPDTCLADDSKDPIHNFMNYTDDACMDRFTPNQVVRMHEQCGVFRPGLFEANDELRNMIRDTARSASR